MQKLHKIVCSLREKRLDNLSDLGYDLRVGRIQTMIDYAKLWINNTHTDNVRLAMHIVECTAMRVRDDEGMELLIRVYTRLAEQVN